jgi:hypothetical protein
MPPKQIQCTLTNEFVLRLYSKIGISPKTQILACGDSNLGHRPSLAWTPLLLATAPAVEA